MNIEFHSSSTLHLSVKPSIKSWSIFFGIISLGIGASYSSPEDHPLLKLCYLFGCLILGLTFLDDWEDCVIDQTRRQLTLTRRNWLEILTSRCPDYKTIVLDTNAVVGVKVVHFKSQTYKVKLLLRNGTALPISETAASDKSHEEMVADCVTRLLGLDRLETLYFNQWDDSDDDTISFSTTSNVENVEGNAFSIDDESKADEAEVRSNEARQRLDEFDEADASDESADTNTTDDDEDEGNMSDV